MRALFPLLALFCLCLPGSAQTSEGEEPASLRYGRAALEKGEHQEAFGHLMYALARAEAPVPLVALLLENAAQAESADAQALWAHEYFALAADDRGHLSLKADLKQWMPQEDPWPAALAAARAEAVRELVKFRDRQASGRGSGDPFLAEWAEDLARRLALESPALRNRYADDLTPAVEVSNSLQKTVMKSLMRVARQGFSTSDPSLTVRAARCLRGMGAQANFQDLEGPDPPSTDKEVASANASLQRAREMLAKESRVWSIEELEDFDEDMQRAFTLEHATFANPGVALSPNGLYRVETSCGYWTLLGTAQTVEEHHERLLAWYGFDPFEGRQGLVRIVPESHGLEMEGAGYWWVGGFQGGDVTTLAFTLSNIPALGRGLTHELTHRFDGAAYGGLPGWLAEGRAVWTGAHYGSMYEREFVDDYLNFGTMFDVAQMGYGEPEKLATILDGENEEYRDNYSAGYALFSYLRSWTGFEDTGKPLFRERLEAYQEDRKRSRSGGAAGFVKYFCDGKDGRPETLEDFAADFDKFLRGFYWKELAPWTKRYDPGAPSGDAAERVMDEPTSTWLRRRAEPWFGQDQARMAAEVLVTAGLDRESLPAYLWALAVDEPSDAVLEDLAAVLDRVDEADAAWVVRNWPRFAAPRRDWVNQEAGTSLPFLNKLPKTEALWQAMGEAAEDYAQRGLDTVSAVMRAEADRLGAALGLPSSGQVLAPALEEMVSLHPLHRPSRQLGLAGWFEDGLTGHEKNRVEGLWFVDHRGDLQVGRKELRGGTDTMDRTSRYRDGFVLSKEWMEPGRYTLRTRIEQTTAFFHGGVVMGYSRRDRNLRFDFAGGDAAFAQGESESNMAGNGFGWSLDGLYARQAPRRGSVGFEREKTTWSLELRVDGPTMEAWVDDQFVGRITTLDARPIQGYIGFYTSTGAIRVIAPEIERRDRLAYLPGATALGRGLHPARVGADKLRDLLDRPVSGMPLASAGTGMLWFPEEKADKLEEKGLDVYAEELEATIALFLEQWHVADPSQGVTIVLPSSLPAELREGLHQRVIQSLVEDEFLPRGGLFWSTHPPRPDLLESGMTVGGWKRPLVLFVDPAGILRFARRLSRTHSGLHRELQQQLLEYQDHRRPGQAGADD